MGGFFGFQPTRGRPGRYSLVKYHELLLAVKVCQKENEHLRQELAAARAMAIDEKMDADRLRSQVIWLQGKR